MHKSTNRGTYRPTQESYPLMESLAVAVAVDRAQGFVKANQGHIDTDTGVRVEDNRTVALRTLRTMHGKPGVDPTALVIVPEPADYEAAQEIFNYFDQVLLLDKMGDSLVKQTGDGRMNDYNLQLSQLFDRGAADVNKELAMLVSLPNSRRIAVTREEMEQFYASHRGRGYIGSVKERVKIAGLVKDVKFLPKYSIHLATLVTDDGRIGKFFVNDKMVDLARRIRGARITFTGTIKKHEVNQFTGCQETVFNRIKMEDF